MKYTSSTKTLKMNTRVKLNNSKSFVTKISKQKRGNRQQKKIKIIVLVPVLKEI